MASWSVGTSPGLSVFSKAAVYPTAARHASHHFADNKKYASPGCNPRSLYWRRKRAIQVAWVRASGRAVPPSASAVESAGGAAATARRACVVWCGVVVVVVVVVCVCVCVCGETLATPTNVRMVTHVVGQRQQ